MTEQTLFQKLIIYRTLTLQLSESFNEDTADIIPKGFNNSIRWHLGHIYLVHENLTFNKSGYKSEIPNKYYELFDSGTKPIEWKSQPPTLKELRDLLKLQPKRIEKVFQGKTHQKAKESYQLSRTLELTTIEEIIHFTCFHEGMHLGIMKGIKHSLGI